MMSSPWLNECSPPICPREPLLMNPQFPVLSMSSTLECPVTCSVQCVLCCRMQDQLPEKEILEEQDSLQGVSLFSSVCPCCRAAAPLSSLRHVQGVGCHDHVAGAACIPDLCKFDLLTECRHLTNTLNHKKVPCPKGGLP